MPLYDYQCVDCQVYSDHLASLGHDRIAYAYIERERHIPRGLRHGAVKARRDEMRELVAQIAAKEVPPPPLPPSSSPPPTTFFILIRS